MSNPTKLSVSVPNFAFELRDFRKPFKRCSDLFTMDLHRLLNDGISAAIKKGILRRSKKTFKKYHYLLRRATLSDIRTRKLWSTIFDLGAQANLNYNFAIAPFVDDLSAMIEGVSASDERIAWLINNQHSVVTKRIPSDLQLMEVPAPKLWTPGSGLGFTQYVNDFTWGADVSASRSYVFKYKYLLPKTGGLNSEVRSGLLGLNGLSLQQIWNAVPWTWLIDWVSNTSSYFGPDYRFPTRLVSVCAVDRITIDYSCSASVNCFHPVTGPPEVAKVWEKSWSPKLSFYKRTYLDSTSPSFRTSGVDASMLNARQLSLVGSIIKLWR